MTLNHHPMVTRSKVGIYKPKLYITALIKEPTSVKVALVNSQWYSAIKEEVSTLHNNHSGTLVPLPPNKQPIGCKWVFRMKQNLDGSLLKLKARLVAKGFSKKEGFYFHETFSSVIKSSTIRVFLTLALTKGWNLHRLDVNNVFLNGDLHE